MNFLNQSKILKNGINTMAGGIRAVSHVIFDMDGLLLGWYYIWWNSEKVT